MIDKWLKNTKIKSKILIFKQIKFKFISKDLLLRLIIQYINIFRIILRMSIWNYLYEVIFLKTK